MVEPMVPLPLEATLVTLKSALLADTPKTAVIVLELVPTLVVNEPEGIVLVTLPATEFVTTAVTVQLEAGGIKLPDASVSVPSPAVAVAATPLQLV